MTLIWLLSWLLAVLGSVLILGNIINAAYREHVRDLKTQLRHAEERNRQSQELIEDLNQKLKRWRAQAMDR